MSDAEQPSVPEGLQDAGYDPLADDRLSHLPESVRARAPKDEDAIAWAEDVLIHTDGEWTELPGTGKHVCVRPMNDREIKEWFGEGGDPTELDDAAIVAALREFYLVPNLREEGVETAEDLRKLKGYSQDPLLGALLDASGMDMARGYWAENSQIVELISGNTSGTS